MDKRSVKVSDVGEAVLADNLALLFERAKRNAEQRSICAELLTDELFAKKGAYELDAIYKQLCSLCNGSTVTERVLICKRLCALAGEATVVNELYVFGESESVEKQALGRIAYVKNRRNDDAFLTFSKSVGGAKAEYVAGFQEACEAVVNNKSELCIIPIENDADGKLYSFYNMLDRYDLKIRETARMSGEDGAQGIVFALVSGSIRVALKDGKRQRFEFEVVGEGADLVGDVLVAASALGGEVYSTASLPVRYDEGSRRCYFAIDLEASEVVTMALYLSLEYHGYTPLGLYSI